MKSEWPLVPIGEVAQLFDGPHATPKKTNDGPVFLGISSLKRGQLDLSSTEHLSEEDFSKWTRRVVPHVGDVVFSYETRIGEVAIIPEGLKCCLGRRMALLRPDQTRLLPKYLLYYFLSDEFQGLLRTRTIHGSTVDRLPLTDFPSYPVRIPSIEVQRSISEVLEAFDKRIALLRETNSTLETIAQTLFKSWFVDFDPVRAKAEGRQLEGIDATTAALFPDSFEESELGLVPKGWEAGVLSDLASFQNGYAFRSQDWVDTGHPVVKIGDVKPGLINFSGCSRVAPTTVVGLERFKLSRGDLLVGMTGYVGETGLVPRVEPDAYINQRVGRLVTRAGLSDIGMVYCAVRDPAYKAYAESQSHGSAQANVSGAALLAYPVVIPSPEVLSRFNHIVEPLLESILSNHEQAQTLTQLRDTLLPRLISGQLRLPEAMAEITKSTAQELQYAN
ncbi:MULTISPECIES: restriction endonuclease subunit S [Pseudomonadaceae]|uniref:Restriction modification system DNA specificity domain protein n=1 Tax=Stutzerimonas stutzeri (strain ATCC 17588 / DSM 5190 / CCUG 11256 / JCM 5965 / LMG 11199 / NBRC 14165 / NCIMB 11358 / Stanier 221) TaxID=96563 RepID=F8GZN4_STUS2|nr:MULTISPECIES: restriction endonuclease subunit S [Pseudomonadaceae]AEJ06678.1 restriction modification system DNA specificity domain protein [Stutzerimonas stutzeri]QPT31534.1 restriction endonuclease subunit S [Stutzerimonas stutzeri]